MTIKVFLVGGTTATYRERDGWSYSLTSSWLILQQTTTKPSRGPRDKAVIGTVIKQVTYSNTRVQRFEVT